MCVGGFTMNKRGKFQPGKGESGEQQKQYPLWNAAVSTDEVMQAVLPPQTFYITLKKQTT